MTRSESIFPYPYFEHTFHLRMQVHVTYVLFYHLIYHTYFSLVRFPKAKRFCESFKVIP